MKKIDGTRQKQDITKALPHVSNVPFEKEKDVDNESIEMVPTNDSQGRVQMHLISHYNFASRYTTSKHLCI